LSHLIADAICISLEETAGFQDSLIGEARKPSGFWVGHKML